MGTSSSTAASARTQRGPTLPERDAWAIATAWREQLQGCVRLETDPQRDNGVDFVPTFEWITFVFTTTASANENDVLAITATARVQTIAWFALSCCPGYSGAENPQFWRRVFSALVYPRPRLIPPISARPPQREQRAITDAVRFFDCVDKPFPRVKLVAKEDEAISARTKIFLGLTHHPDDARDSKLQRLLTKLEPFMKGSLWTRHVPVAVDKVPPATLEMLLRSTLRSPSEQRESPQQEPEFRLISAVLHSKTHLQLDHLQSQLQSLSDVEIIVKSAHLSDIIQNRQLPRALFPSEPPPVLDELQQRPQQQQQLCRPRWRVSKVDIGQVDEFLVPDPSPLCSALPHLRSIDCVATGSRRLSASPSDWAWLGYAMFHPDAATHSSFFVLDFALKYVSHAQLDALKSMATGNNWFCNYTRSGINPPQLQSNNGSSTAYHEALVQASTNVWTHQHRTTDAAPLCTLTTATWLGLCVSSPQELESYDWICTVVPGVGLGWIQRSDIVQVRSRPPGLSCVRTLRINAWDIRLDVHPLTGYDTYNGITGHDQFTGRTPPVGDGYSLLTELLAIMGDRVTTLEIYHSDLLTTATVQGILRLCPSLKTLRIRHDGSCWSDPALVMDQLPRLEELELHIDGPLNRFSRMQPLHAACLPYLKKLRVVSMHEDGLQEHESHLLSFLRQSQMLEYLHWSKNDSARGGYINPWRPASYKDLHKLTTTFRNKLARGVDDIAHGHPFRLECRLAFLSVVHHNHCNHNNQNDNEDYNHTPSAIGRLAQDAVTAIFQFASSTGDRTIYISP